MVTGADPSLELWIACGFGGLERVSPLDFTAQIGTMGRHSPGDNTK